MKALTASSGKENVEKLIENTAKTLFQSVDNFEILITLIPEERQQETLQTCQKKLRKLLDHISNLEHERSLKIVRDQRPPDTMCIRRFCGFLFYYL